VSLPHHFGASQERLVVCLEEADPVGGGLEGGTLCLWAPRQVALQIGSLTVETSLEVLVK